MSEPRIPAPASILVRTPATGVPAAATERSPLDAPMTSAERALWEQERTRMNRRHVLAFTGAVWGIDVAARALGALLGFGPELGLGAVVSRSLVELVIGGGIAAVVVPRIGEVAARERWLKGHRLRRALLE